MARLKALSARVMAAPAELPRDVELERGAARARLVLIAMGVVGAGATLLSIMLMMRASQLQHESELRALVKGQARLIEAVARFDAIESQDATPAGAWLATLSQVAAGHAGWADAANDAMTLAIVGKVDGQLVTHVQDGALLAPHSPPLDAEDATALQTLDLTGARARHYRSADRTAWFAVVEPIPSLGMAVVARMNLDVLNRPSLEAMTISAGAALALIVLGAFLVRRTSYRTVRDLASELGRRRRAEVLLANHQLELERAVEERTEELQHAQTQLLESERLATLGQVTAKVSHELRNPLATVRNSVHNLRAKLDDPTESTQRIFDRIERNVVRCDRIIGELLAYTKPRAALRQNIELTALLDSVADDYAAASSSVVWKLEPSCVVFVDPEDVRRVVINLVNNALDASATTASAVVVTGRSDGDGVVLEVVDNAGGMPPTVLTRALEPLFSTKNFGVGLGLPIVKELVERNLGTFTLESTEGHGTTARIRLPRA